MEGITYDEFKEILKRTLKEDEFEYIARNLLAGDVSEEELKEHEGFGDATDDEDSDSEDDDMVDDDLSLLDED